MRNKYGCDMRGLLSFQILFLLSKRHMSGEELAQEIKARRGEKPKAGTIYPALKELSAMGLIRGSRSGKTITYELTPSGRKSLVSATRYFVRCFGDIMSG